MGHIAKDCGKEAPIIRCYSCGERGHKAPQCPGKLGAAASSVRIAPSAATKGKGVANTSERVLTLTKKTAEATLEVVSGTTPLPFLCLKLHLCNLELFSKRNTPPTILRYYNNRGTYARVLLDSGATHSFVSLSFATKLGRPFSPLPHDLGISTPLGETVRENLVIQIVSCPWVARLSYWI